jgi:uncharacterized phage protein (TIGR01671 family)
MLLLACIDGLPFAHLVECDANGNFLKHHVYNASSLELTVQQYIGIDDINDKPIYEGDIVRYRHWERSNDTKIETSVGEVFFEDGIFYFGRGVWFAANDSNFSETTLEVIGNIFENPELLK